MSPSQALHTFPGRSSPSILEITQRPPRFFRCTGNPLFSLDGFLWSRAGTPPLPVPKFDSPLPRRHLRELRFEFAKITQVVSSNRLNLTDPTGSVPQYCWIELLNTCFFILGISHWTGAMMLYLLVLCRMSSSDEEKAPVETIKAEAADQAERLSLVKGEQIFPCPEYYASYCSVADPGC
jgi:hypothetical protein